LPLPKINQGEVDKILQEYQDEFAPNQVRHILSSTQGEPSSSMPSPTYPSRQQLYSSSNTKPRSTANFRVMDLTLDEIVLTLIHPTTYGFLCIKSWIALSCIDKTYNRLLKESIRLEKIDFSPISQPRYQEQKSICDQRVDMHSACFLYYKGDVGLLTRFMGHEYTGAHRDVDACLNRIKPHINDTDFQDIERILRTGCPHSIDYELPKASKSEMIARGNQKSLIDHMDLDVETMNKEERHSHIIPLHNYLCRFGPSCQHIPQGMNLRKGKRRLISDGSTKLHPKEIVVNEMTSIENEPRITFGETKNNGGKQIIKQVNLFLDFLSLRHRGGP
jgi:hypothetical protein